MRSRGLQIHPRERAQTVYFGLSGRVLASRKHPGGTREHPGGTQEAPRRPGTSWSQNVSQHERLRTKVVGARSFACTGATWPSPFTAPARKISRAHGRKKPSQQYLIQKIHRQSPYSRSDVWRFHNISNANKPKQVRVIIVRGKGVKHLQVLQRGWLGKQQWFRKWQWLSSGILTVGSEEYDDVGTVKCY